jgi:hypothetical protein
MDIYDEVVPERDFDPSELQYKRVRCEVDDEEFICTPYSDYYNATGETDENGVYIGGVCEDHLLSEASFERVETVIPLDYDLGIIGRKPATEPERS